MARLRKALQILAYAERPGGIHTGKAAVAVYHLEPHFSEKRQTLITGDTVGFLIGSSFLMQLVSCADGINIAASGRKWSVFRSRQFKAKRGFSKQVRVHMHVGYVSVRWLPLFGVF